MLAATGAAGREPFAAKDLRVWRTASDPRIRADGKWAVYVEAAGDGRSNLWVASADGRERRQWTDGSWRDRSPRWSPDGERIAWISDRGGNAHVRVRRFDSTAEVEIRSEAAPVALAWSAEGEAIAFTAQVDAAKAPVWAPADALPFLRRAAPVAQVFVVPSAGGTPRQVSRAGTGCASEPSWSLDGKVVVAACDGALVALDARGGAAKRLTTEPGLYEAPIVSPDGARIAFLRTDRKPQSYVVRKVWVMNADGSRARALSGSLDRDARAPQWSSESRTVYFVADDRGATHVYAARNDGTLRQVTNKAERLAGFSLADNGRAVSVRSTATEGGDVVTFTVDSITQPVTLAAPNERLLAERDLGGVEEMSYASEGRTIQAWLVKPASFDASKKYPLLVDVADDPRRMYGVEFQLRAQMFAARGFVVLCANPRGAPGYGEEFGSLLRTRNPGDDFDDLMRGVDTAVAKGYVDGQRVAIAGGLVAAWAIGHSTRFYRAVARRPIVDWTAAPERAAEALGVMAWEDPELYVKRSPIFAAQNFRTPTLILAGEAEAQSEMLYEALRARGVEAAMLRAADPVVELETVAAWLTAEAQRR
jgi:dipeptidyl aminopeptidase/acylaminoacyl peptidase